MRYGSRCACVLILLGGCFLEPEYTFTSSGTVVSAATGAPIANAAVSLRFREPFSSYSEYPVILAGATTDDLGRFTIVIGPPPGYARANCGTLGLSASAVGYADLLNHGVDAAGNSDCADGEGSARPMRLLPAVSQ